MSNSLETPLSAMPDAVIAGDTLKVASEEIFAAFPAGSGYAVSWIFTPMSGGTPVSVAATSTGSAWLVLVSAAITASWAKGQMGFAVRASKAGEIVTVERGVFSVAANPATADLDQRTHAAKVLDALEAAIEGRASRTDLEIQFEDGRRVKSMSHGELLKMRDAYAAKVRTEQRKAAGLGAPRILVSI